LANSRSRANSAAHRGDKTGFAVSGVEHACMC
jgi:hypothetical protein